MYVESDYFNNVLNTRNILKSFSRKMCDNGQNQ